MRNTLLADRDRLVKGPYISISLPFQQGRRTDWFPELQLPFPPYRHQEQAFERLSPGSPQNTLVATGTQGPLEVRPSRP
jgi:DEAD/DEAH box helicase domain-containing protein